MSEVKIELDAQDLAEKVNNALATTLVGQMVSGFITQRLIKEETLSREYERAVNEVAHQVFIEYLQKDEAFLKRVRALVTETANDTFLKQFIEKMKRSVSW